MAWLIIALAALFTIYLGVHFWWRYASRRKSLPCPAWLAFLFTNPLAHRMGTARFLGQLNVTPGMRVLDVGCGPGRNSIPAAQLVGPSGQVLALDVQRAMLVKLEQRAAARGVANIRTSEGPIETATLESNCFDCALLVCVLGEIPDRAKGLQQIFSALKPGGVLLISELLLDPHYQRLATVLHLAEGVGFQRHQYQGGWISYTLLLAKP